MQTEEYITINIEKPENIALTLTNRMWAQEDIYSDDTYQSSIGYWFDSLDLNSNNLKVTSADEERYTISSDGNGWIPSEADNTVSKNYKLYATAVTEEIKDFIATIHS